MRNEINLLLYSGGIDSLCAKEILERQGLRLVPVRFRFDTPYVMHEDRVVLEYNSLLRGSSVDIVDCNTLDGFGYFDAHIPARNALLVLMSVVYAYRKFGFDSGRRINIYFPQILEFGRDKNEVFWFSLEKILRWSYGYNVKICRPFKRWTKWKLIKESKLGQEFINRYSWSCYYPDGEDYCYRCYGCLMREYSFMKLGWPYRYVEPVKYTVSGMPLIYVFDLDKVLYWLFDYARWRYCKW